MKNYLKLTNFEFNRFSKFYGSLIIIVILTQLTSVFLYARTYMDKMRSLLYEESLTEAAALAQMDPANMVQVTRQSLFALPIALAVGGMMLYCFFIWYREWNGKNTFVYRLLMLPTERINIFFSKLTVVFTSILGLIAVQIILLAVGNWILQAIVPTNFMLDLTITEIAGSSTLLYYFIPASFVEFLVFYGMGLMFLIVLFTVILLERSFHIRGIVIGILYAFISGLVFFSPLLAEIVMTVDLLFPSEKLLLTFATGILVSLISIWLSHYLLNKKITV